MPSVVEKVVHQIREFMEDFRARAHGSGFDVAKTLYSLALFYSATLNERFSSEYYISNQISRISQKFDGMNEKLIIDNYGKYLLPATTALLDLPLHFPTAYLSSNVNYELLKQDLKIVHSAWKRLYPGAYLSPELFFSYFYLTIIPNTSKMDIKQLSKGIAARIHSATIEGYVGAFDKLLNEDTMDRYPFWKRNPETVIPGVVFNPNLAKIGPKEFIQLWNRIPTNLYLEHYSRAGPLHEEIFKMDMLLDTDEPVDVSKVI